MFRLGRETLSATTGGLRLGNGHFETATGQGIRVIHRGALQVTCADRVHHDRYAEEFRGEIAIAFLVQGHGVLHARTTTGFDVNAQAF